MNYMLWKDKDRIIELLYSDKNYLVVDSKNINGYMRPMISDAIVAIAYKYYHCMNAKLNIPSDITQFYHTRARSLQDTTYYCKVQTMVHSGFQPPIFIRTKRDTINGIPNDGNIILIIDNCSLDNNDDTLKRLLDKVLIKKLVFIGSLSNEWEQVLKDRY